MTNDEIEAINKAVEAQRPMIEMVSTLNTRLEMARLYLKQIAELHPDTDGDCAVRWLSNAIEYAKNGLEKSK